MNKISSDFDYLFKRIFPIIWFGILGYVFISNLLISIDKGKEHYGMMFIVTIGAILGYIIMKKYLFNLIDEVYDEGDSLLFKNKGKEVRVNLREIKNISYSASSSPACVKIHLKHDTVLGKELCFSPADNIEPQKQNSAIEQLIERVEKARG